MVNFRLIVERMSEAGCTPLLVRFGVFDLDLRSGELRKHGLRIHLQEQPFRVLALLVQRTGEVVRRDELARTLWSAETFVDFEDGLNTVIRKIRIALGDSADHPRLIETLPRRGYRFIGHVDGVMRRTESPAESAIPEPPAEPPGPQGIFSIAVLPFENLSGDPRQDYFADAMTEALTTNLAQIQALRVISRTSAMHYAHTRKRMPEIADELGVQAAVEGAVSCSRDRVRITAQLIHANTDRHLWAGTYERELHDVLLLQHEVALAIATEVEIHLSPAGKEHPSSPRAAKPEALEACRRGRYFWSRRSEEALNLAIEYFNQATQQDPGYAPAYAGLSDSYTALALSSMRSPLETFPKAKAAALAALNMDDQLADAHFSLAAVLMLHEWDWSRSELGFKRSIELNPSYSHARPWYALGLAALGRQVEALAECERALRIDPLSRHIMLSFATVLYLARDYDRAIAMGEKMLEMDPAGFYQAHWVLGAAYEGKRMGEQAVRSFEMATAISDRNPHMLASLGHALAKSGQTQDACRLIDELNERSKHSYVAPFNIAIVYAGLGQKAEALEWLEKAYEKRSIWMIFLNAYPIFDDLRLQPGFQVLVRRMGLLP